MLQNGISVVYLFLLLFFCDKLGVYVQFSFSPLHTRRRSNVFGDARFWFLPKPNQILPNLIKFYPNFTKSNQILPNLIKFYPNFTKFTQILPKLYQIYSNFTQICPNLTQIGLHFAQICLKKLARECGCIPNSYVTAPLDSVLRFWIMQHLTTVHIHLYWRVRTSLQFSRN